MGGFGNNQRVGIGVTAKTTRLPLSEQTSSFLPVFISSGSVKSQSLAVHSGSLTAMDELYLWAVNNGSSSAFVTLSFDDERNEGYRSYTNELVITKLQPSGGAVLIWPGIPILSLNERTPTVVYASGSVHSTISVHGYVLKRSRRSRTDINAGYDGAE
jgi:hypothetical protein